MIPCQRHLFEIPEDIAYINCGYISPLMKSVRAAGEDGVGRKARPWEIVPEHFFGASETARGLFARLIGADAADIAIVPAASYGLATAALNLEIGAGSRVIVLAEQFPSNVYPWREAAGAHDAEVLTIERPPDGDWTSALVGAIDGRAAVVAVPHCHWTDGALVDLERVGARCREVGAALVVDATQSLGALPLDIGACDPDFLVAACYKWLFGPYSLGFLYVAPRHQHGRPLEHNWIQRERSEDFANLVNYRDAYQPGARRFDVGERSNFALMPMAIAAFEQIHAWGVAEIARTLAARTAAIVERAAPLGLRAAPEASRAGHYLGLRFAHAAPEDLASRLAEEKVYVSVRGDCLRVTPHLYNNDADIDRLFAVLEAVM